MSHGLVFSLDGVFGTPRGRSWDIAFGSFSPISEGKVGDRALCGDSELLPQVFQRDEADVKLKSILVCICSPLLCVPFEAERLITLPQ